MALVSLLAAAQEEGSHENDAGDEAPEEDALIARNHRGTPAGVGVGAGTGALCVRQEVRPERMA